MEKLKFLVSGELFFVLFLTSGAFKESLEMGFDVAPLFLGCTLLSILYRINLDRIIKRKYVLPIFLFFLLLLVILLSLVYSDSLINSKVKIIKFILLTMPAFLIPFFLIKNSAEALNKFYLFICGIAAVLSVIALYNYFIVSSAAFGFVGFNEGNYLGLGRITGMALIILITNFLLGNISKGFKVISLISLIIIMTTLFIAGSRMPLIASIIIIAYLIITSIKINKGIIYLRKGTKLLFSLVLITSFFVAYLARKGFLDTIIYRMSVLFSEDGGASANERVLRYGSALNQWLDNPLFGNGIGSFGINYNGIDMRAYPHNIFLEFLSELGILGFVIFITLIIIGLIHSYNAFKSNKELNNLNLTTVSVFVFLLINASISGDINDNRMLFTFISLLCILSILHKKRESNRIINNQSKIFRKGIINIVRSPLK
ncbi:O-antigen ligase family protein [Peribacillus frigoritolerans]|uniref:O-antigen ligase family protein n=1 Tax=Peribacillus frigoritolerans TaxID=450367 RepID=UPI00399F692D